MKHKPTNPALRFRRSAISAALPLLLAATMHVAVCAAVYEPPPEGTPIGEVQVRGLSTLEQDRITRVMELQPGEGFSAEMMRRDQQSIAGTGLIEPLSIEFSYEPLEGSNGVRLIVTVAEAPELRSVQFVGNVKYSAKQLQNEIDFKEGDRIPADARSRTIRALRNFYGKGGYKNARVEVAFDDVPDAPGARTMTISIDEGERIRIADLLIHGNRHFSDLSIRMKLQNTGSWLIFENYYDDRAFEEDLRVVEEMYRGAGFLDARARRGEFIYNQSKAVVSPVIEVEEGPRYYVHEVAVAGVTLFTAEEVNAPFQRMVGKPFNGERFRTGMEKLRALYGSQGYINAELTPRFEKDAETGRLHLGINVVENNVVYVGQIRMQRDAYRYDIELNPLQDFVEKFSPPAKDETVLKEVRLVPGERYRTQDEVRTIERLKSLRFFERVEIKREPTADPNVQDAVIELEESRTGGHFLIAAGIGESSGPAVTVAYQNPNLYGDGDRFSASATVGSRTRRFRMSYFDRYLGGSETSYEIAAYKSSDRYRMYNERTYGLSNEFGRPLSEHRQGYLRFRLEQTNFSRIRGNPREDFDSYVTAAARVMLVEDRTDGEAWPSRGYRISGGLETGVADGFLLKATHTYDRYFALGGDWVYAYRHTAGLMPYDATDIGLGERFFVGGSSDLRGFRPREVGPRDRDEDRLAIGGSTRLTQRHELRYPFTKKIRGRIFTDIAMLERDAFDFGRPRMGSGFGVNIDMGPVTLDLDIGFAVMKRRHDKTRVLSFRIGSNF